MTEPAITAGTIVTAVDTVLSSFHSIAARDKILVFSGGPGDTKTIYEWFRHSERLAKPFRWRDVDKIQYFSDKLEGPGLHFHSAIWSDNLAQDLRTYAEWKKRMIVGFVTIADKDAERKRLQEITQIDGQRVRDYIYKLDAMYRLVYGDALADTTNADFAKIREDTKLPLFLKGLLKKFKDRIWTRLSSDTYTYAEACAAALQVEQMVLLQEVIDPTSPYPVHSVTPPQSDPAIMAEIESLKMKLQALNLSENPIAAITRTPSKPIIKRESRDHSNPRVTYSDQRRSRQESRSRSRDGQRPSRDDSRYRSPSRERSSNLPNNSGRFPRSTDADTRGPSPYRSRATSPLPNKRSGRTKLTCHTCGYTGHFAKDCRVPRERDRPEKRDRPFNPYRRY